jgi:biopolymer transport protein ExbB/TolQ
MIDLFNAGGPLFMSLLTILLVLVIWAFFSAPELLNILGKLALGIGILGQLIGLYSMFDAIESIQEGVSPSLISGGLKVSLISTLYGVGIYLNSLMLFGVYSVKNKQTTNDS